MMSTAVLTIANYRLSKSILKLCQDYIHNDYNALIVLLLRRSRNLVHAQKLLSLALKTLYL